MLDARSVMGIHHAVEIPDRHDAVRVAGRQSMAVGLQDDRSHRKSVQPDRGFLVAAEIQTQTPPWLFPVTSLRSSGRS